MATVPLDQKFHTIAANVVTKERGSSLVNSQKEIFTMQDIIDTAGGLGGTQYVFVAANGTDVENAAELQAAYVTAQGMSPSATNRITVIAAPGNYNFSAASFVMDTEFIDLVSLDGNRSIVFNDGAFRILISASNVFVRGVDVGTSAFVIEGELDYLRIENCSGGDYSFCVGSTIASSSTFTDCTGGIGSFGGEGGKANGTFTNCIGGNLSFGGGNQADGTFTNCIGGDYSFGGQASGTFTDCQGGDYSFGGGNQADGTFTNCQGKNYSFGGGALANGTFTNCTGGDYSFGGGNQAGGVFNSCTGRSNSFGGDGGTANGVFTNCTGGDRAFGGNGTLDGYLYYCRLKGGTFETVSGGGRTVLCIDGNNDQNNQ